MRRITKGISTIEILVLVGLLGIVFFIGLKSYRSHLMLLESNYTTIDFDHTVEIIEKEFVLIKETLNIQSAELSSISTKLDTAAEWLELVNSKIDLNTVNVLITSLDGSIEENNLVIGVGIEASVDIAPKNTLICWESRSYSCQTN